MSNIWKIITNDSGNFGLNRQIKLQTIFTNDQSNSICEIFYVYYFNIVDDNGTIPNLLPNNRVVGFRVEAK